jgi:hypothetical protein
MSCACDICSALAWRPLTRFTLRLVFAFELHGAPLELLLQHLHWLSDDVLQA